MRSILTKSILALTFGFLVLTGSAEAQTMKTGKVRPPVADGPIVGLTAQSGVLSVENVRDMLRGLGYEPSVRKSGSMDVLHLSIRRDDWTFEFDVSVSGNKKKIWMSCFFDPYSRDPNARELANLLDASFKHGPAHFTYNPTNRQLNLGLPLDNRGITADILRTEVETFIDTIRKTESLWNLR